MYLLIKAIWYSQISWGVVRRHTILGILMGAVTIIIESRANSTNSIHIASIIMQSLRYFTVSLFLL